MLVHERESNKINTYKQALHQMDIPEASLQQAIHSGFQKAKSERKAPFHGKKLLISVAMVAFLLVGWIASIQIYELVKGNKGLMLAIEHNYFEEIGVSQKKNGLDVTIDGAIADKKGLVLFYTLKSDKKEKELFMEDVQVLNEQGEKIPVSSVNYGPAHYSEDGKNKYHGKIEIFFAESIDTTSFHLEFKMGGGGRDDRYQIPFSIDKDIMKREVYPVDETIEMDKQKINVSKVVVSPLRVAVHMQIDPNNTKHLVDFPDIHLVDETGETWGEVAVGLTTEYISEQEQIIYLQSNYFKEPEELYLVLKEVQAINKSESKVVVDVKEETVLEQPSGNKFSDFEIKGHDLIFTMPREDEFPFSLFGAVKDADGNELTVPSVGYHYDTEQKTNKYTVWVKDLSEQQSPITLDLEFYPEWIWLDEEVSVPIKK